MNYYDDEMHIIEHLKTVSEFGVEIFPYNEGNIKFAKNFFESDFSKDWINSSSKSAPPPDFYSDKYRTMLEVMRVDDHAYKDENGKLVNPTVSKESKLAKEIFNSDWYKSYPNKPNILVTATSGLPSKQDHNYKFYYKNFQRVVSHHIDKIPLYRKNHPGYKLIFLVFDESTLYVVADTLEEATKVYNKGDLMNMKIHHHVLDKHFVNVLVDADVDYLIWFSPYKQATFSGVAPKLCNITVINIKEMKEENFIVYDEELIISSEE